MLVEAVFIICDKSETRLVPAFLFGVRSKISLSAILTLCHILPAREILLIPTRDSAPDAPLVRASWDAQHLIGFLASSSSTLLTSHLCMLSRLTSGKKKASDHPSAAAATAEQSGISIATSASRRSRGSGESSVSSSSSTSSNDTPSWPSYSYLVFSHVVALVPTVAFLITFGILSLRQRCRLPLREHSDEDSRLSYAHCSRMLGPTSTLGWSFFLMGITGYAAVNKIRSLISRASVLIYKVVKFYVPRSGREKQQQEDESTGFTILTCALRAAFTEAFRIPLIVTATAVVLAELTLRNHNRQQRHSKEFDADLGAFVQQLTEDEPPLRNFIRWTMLDPRDARFRVAVWLALGWGTANFVTGSVKLLRNLTLYTPLYLAESEGEIVLPRDETDDEEVQAGFRSSGKDREQSHEVENDPRTPGSTAHRRVVTPGASMDVTSSSTPGPPYTYDHSEGDSIYRGQVPETSRPAGYQRPGGHVRGQLSRPKWLVRNRSGLSRRRRSETDREARESAGATGADDSQGSDYFGASVRPHIHNAEADDESAMSMMLELEDQIDRLVAARRRVNLERSLGASLPELPPALAALWRLDDALWSVGSILLIASAIAIGQGPILSTSAGTGNEAPSNLMSHHKHHYTKEDTASMWPDYQAIGTTYLALAVLHSGFNSAFTLALASWGWPAVTYSSLLVGMGVMVAGLARWGLVV